MDRIDRNKDVSEASAGLSAAKYRPNNWHCSDTQFIAFFHLLSDIKGVVPVSIGKHVVKTGIFKKAKKIGQKRKKINHCDSFY